MDLGAQVVAVEPLAIPEDISVPRRDSALSAWVNVIHGCNERCTYCVVPNTRGVEQSRAPDAIRVRGSCIGLCADARLDCMSSAWCLATQQACAGAGAACMLGLACCMCEICLCVRVLDTLSRRAAHQAAGLPVLSFGFSAVSQSRHAFPSAQRGSVTHLCNSLNVIVESRVCAAQREILALGEAGYREVTLLGQNVDAYGRDLPGAAADGSGNPRTDECLVCCGQCRHMSQILSISPSVRR